MSELRPSTAHDGHTPGAGGGIILVVMSPNPQRPSRSHQSPRRRLRATDAQRDSVWKALDAAMTDGQLDRFEHLERTRAVHRTTYVDELRPLVADLQGVTTDLPDESGRPARAGDAAGLEKHGGEKPAGDTRRRQWPVVAGVAAALVVVGVAVVASPPGDTPGPDLPSISAPAEPGPLHTDEGLERMLASAREEFGDVPIDVLTVHGDRATLMYEDPTEPGKRLSHQFSGGEWQEPSFHSRTESATFRLDGIDATTVMDALESAPAELGREGAPVSHVSVFADVLGEPEFTVAVHAGERLGTVRYDHDGDVLRVDAPN